MFVFNMSVKENFASFKDNNSEKIVLIDSFDNKEFSVRLGNIEQSFLVGNIFANTDDELNTQLTTLIARFT